MHFICSLLPLISIHQAIKQVETFPHILQGWKDLIHNPIQQTIEEKVWPALSQSTPSILKSGLDEPDYSIFADLLPSTDPGRRGRGRGGGVASSLFASLCSR